MNGQVISFDVTNGFYQSDSLPFSNQRCVNLYVNAPQVSSLTSGGLWNTEGLVEVARTGTGVANSNRGGIEFQNEAYFVNGSNLCKLERTIPPVGDPVYNYAIIGEIGGEGRVSLAENGTQLMIIDSDGTGYIYAPQGSPSFQIISDAGFTANGTPQQVTHVDSYFVVTTDQKKAIISAVGDGTNWNALDFISAEADPDDVVAPFVHKNQLYLLGSITTEQYQNIGGSGVPFQRINGFVLDTGCIAPFSVVNSGPTVFWIGNGENEKPAVWAFNGAEPQKISTTAIEVKLHELDLDDLQSTYAFAYAQRGNRFIHFTTPNSTFVFNATNGRWHERESIVTIDGIRNTLPCRIRSVVQVNNDLLTGDSRDGRIGVIDPDFIGEYSEPYISYFSTQPMYASGNEFALSMIELNCETGLGNPDIPDPKVRLEVSRDGVLFENPRTRSLGASGARRTRPIWYKNGRFEFKGTFKFTISDPVRRRIYGINMKVKPLR